MQKVFIKYQTITNYSIEDLCKKLLEYKSINDLKIDRDKQNIELNFDPAKIKINKLYSLIEKYGLKPLSKHITITIGDMMCVGCTGTIKNSIRILPGVLNVEVDFSSKTAEIIYNKSITSLQDINYAVKRAGHQYISAVRGDIDLDDNIESVIEKDRESRCGHI